MSKASRKRRRTYDNSLRETHAAETRRRILDAVARQIWEGRVEDFSVAKVAERSGVSAPTIYRYFPNRTALLDAVHAWLGEELSRPPFPTDASAIGGAARALFEYYERHADRLRMARATTALRELREHGRRERDRAMAALMRPLTDHLPAEKANALTALLRALYGFDAYELMTGRFGVSREDAAEAVGWAVSTLAGELAREGDASRRSKAGRRARREGER